MKKHEESFYNYQTEARKLQNKNSLLNSFKKRKIHYDKIIGKYLPENKDSVIWDIPCGFGNFLYFLAEKGYKNCCGFDFDLNQVKLAEKLDLNASLGDAFDVIKEKNITDALISIDFLEHISRDDACLFLESSYNNLKDEGIMISRVPNADSPFGSGHAWNDITHKWYFTPTAGRVLFEMAGFKKVIFLEDRCEPDNLIKKIKYRRAGRKLDGLIRDMGIAPPRIWSRSMWIVAYK